MTREWKGLKMFLIFYSWDSKDKCGLKLICLEKYRYKFFLKLTLYKSRRFGKQNVMRKLTETKEMEIADKKEKILENMSRNFFYICIRHKPKC